MITGITRISKESIFSDLNNLMVITTTSSQYPTAFGFTEEEVFKALDDTGLGEEKQGVKAWYAALHLVLIRIFTIRGQLNASTDVHRRNVPMTPEMIVPLPTSEQRNAVHARIKTGVSHVS